MASTFRATNTKLARNFPHPLAFAPHCGYRQRGAPTCSRKGGLPREFRLHQSDTGDFDFQQILPLRLERRTCSRHPRGALSFLFAQIERHRPSEIFLEVCAHSFDLNAAGTRRGTDGSTIAQMGGREVLFRER